MSLLLYWGRLLGEISSRRKFHDARPISRQWGRSWDTLSKVVDYLGAETPRLADHGSYRVSNCDDGYLCLRRVSEACSLHLTICRISGRIQIIFYSCDITAGRTHRLLWFLYLGVRHIPYWSSTDSFNDAGVVCISSTTPLIARLGNTPTDRYCNSRDSHAGGNGCN